MKFFAQTYPLVHARWRLYPQVFPVTSKASPMKYNQGIFFDWNVWSRSLNTIPHTDTFASVIGLNQLIRISRTVSQGTSLNVWIIFLLQAAGSKSHWIIYLETSWSINKVVSNMIGPLSPRCVNNRDHTLLYTTLLSAYKVILVWTVFHDNQGNPSWVSIPHKAPWGVTRESHNCSAISYAKGLAPIWG